MAFLDDLNRKISQAGQKAKDFSDTSRINSLISEEEKKINGYYNQVGKLYVSLHTSDYEPDFEGFMASIADSEAKLKDLRFQLQQLKGVKKCPQCNGDVALNAAFCPTCGFQMPRSEAENNLVKCVSCGQFVANNLRFCTFCGKPMNAVPVVEQPAAQMYAQPSAAPGFVQQPVAPVYAQPHVAPETPVYEQAPESTLQLEPTVNEQAPVTPEFIQQPVSQPSNIFCSQCGFSLPSDSAFCTECGSKII